MCRWSVLHCIVNGPLQIRFYNYDYNTFGMEKRVADGFSLSKISQKSIHNFFSNQTNQTTDQEKN